MASRLARHSVANNMHYFFLRLAEISDLRHGSRATHARTAVTSGPNKFRQRRTATVVVDDVVQKEW